MAAHPTGKPRGKGTKKPKPRKTRSTTTHSF